MTYEIPNWPTESPTWKGECLTLLQESSTRSIPDTNLDEIIKRSDKFSTKIKFPINTVRCKTLLATVKKETLERNIKSSYPIVHESVLYLYAQFLIHKRKNGTEKEKNLYKNINLIEFVDRLLTKRAVTFMGKWDSYVLRNGERANGKWETIGQPHEKPPLLMEDYLTYDEIKVSVFLSVSSYNYFINNGTRKNRGVVAESRAGLEQEGIVIGLIGARFKKVNKMEYEETIISRAQNTAQNGYGDQRADTLHTVFSGFYQEPPFLFNEVDAMKTEKKNRFTQLEGYAGYFDNVVYAKRLALSFDTLLLEANHRAKEAKKTAYIHVVGIGLGVWKVSDHQEEVFVKTFLQRIRTLGNKLNNVSDVHFSYFDATMKSNYLKDGETISLAGHTNGGVKFHVSRRDPYTKIGTGKLLVVSYAWDGNAQPGNEFWKGQLASTGDSSTAASCQISELHNPFINKMVCGDNLMVATVDEHVPFRDYVHKCLKRKFDDGESSTVCKK